MNKKYTSLLLLLAAFLLNACQKDLDEFIPDPGQVTGPDTSWYAATTAAMPVAVLKNNLLIQPVSDSFDVTNSPVSLVFPSGLQCAFPPHSLVSNTSQPVTGKAELETILLTKKGDIVRMGTPTISDGKLLISGGEFFIRAKKNGDELQLAPNVRVNVHYPDPSPSPLMKIFNGDGSNPQQFNWIKNYDSLCNVSVGNQHYEIVSRNLHWINCDYFYDTTVARTHIAAGLPLQYTNANTIVYMVFNDIRSVIAMYGSITLHKFISSSVPIGEAVTIIVISKQGDDYYMGHQNVGTSTPPAGANTQLVPLTPVKVSLAAIKQYLDTL